MIYQARDNKNIGFSDVQCDMNKNRAKSIVYPWEI